jgi:hypothetical protein
VKYLKIVVVVQAIALLYAFRENSHLKEHLSTSAEAVGTATRKIERMSERLSYSEDQLDVCQYSLNKYKESTDRVYCE